MAKVTKSFPAFISKAEGEAGIVGAFTSIMGNIDFGYDIITSGAFTKTIAERGHKIRVLDNHNSWSTMDAIGKVISIREVGRAELPLELQAQYPDATGGLYVEIQFMLDDEMSAGVFRRIKAGVIDEYSIGFEIIRQEIKVLSTNEGDQRIRVIHEIKLFEVSPVIFAMNGATTTVSAKAKDAKGDTEDGPMMPMEKDGPIYLSNGEQSCVGCKLFGKVTDELGFCQHHKMATANVMLCDDYETINKRLVRDMMRENFSIWMLGQIEGFMELGAWAEGDQARLSVMAETLTEAFLDMLPKDMTTREIPTPPVLTVPKSLPQEDTETAEPPASKDAETLTVEAQAEALTAQIKARMALI